MLRESTTGCPMDCKYNNAYGIGGCSLPWGVVCPHATVSSVSTLDEYKLCPIATCPVCGARGACDDREPVLDWRTNFEPRYLFRCPECHTLLWVRSDQVEFEYWPNNQVYEYSEDDEKEGIATKINKGIDDADNADPKDTAKLHDFVDSLIGSIPQSFGTTCDICGDKFEVNDPNASRICPKCKKALLRLREIFDEVDGKPVDVPTDDGDHDGDKLTFLGHEVTELEDERSEGCTACDARRCPLDHLDTMMDEARELCAIIAKTGHCPFCTNGMFDCGDPEHYDCSDTTPCDCADKPACTECENGPIDEFCERSCECYSDRAESGKKEHFVEYDFSPMIGRERPDAFDYMPLCDFIYRFLPCNSEVEVIEFDSYDPETNETTYNTLFKGMSWHIDYDEDEIDYMRRRDIAICPPLLCLADVRSVELSGPQPRYVIRVLR